MDWELQKCMFFRILMSKVEVGNTIQIKGKITYENALNSLQKVLSIKRIFAQ
jgi:hypothetical protein